MKSNIQIYIHGRCNKKSGGWGALIKSTKETLLHGYCNNTTANQMELFAAIESINSIPKFSNITLYSNSRYIVKGITEWFPKWNQKDKEKHANIEFWEELYNLSKSYNIDWVYLNYKSKKCPEVLSVSGISYTALMLSNHETFKEKMKAKPIVDTPKPTQVTIYTDGGCYPNPGPGGWGAVLSCNGKMREIFGGQHRTTNNEMEITAAIEALKLLTRPCEVTIHSDSKYLVDGITKWYPSWVKKGKTGYPNEQRWHQLHNATKQHIVHWKWVKAHVGIELNERADQLATAGRYSLS